MNRVDAIIVGGGISGAAALHWLSKRGVNAVLLERNSGLGGVIGTMRTPSGVLIEAGPNSTQLNNVDLAELIDDLDLTGEIVRPGEAAANRYVMRKGSLIPVPTSPRSLLRSKLFSGPTKRRLLRERFVPPASPDIEESVAGFIERRFGRDLLDYAVNPFVSGIYAGAPERLSLRHTFPMLHELEQGAGSVIRGALKKRKQRRKDRKVTGGEKEYRGMISFREGMSMLPGTIAKVWESRIRTGVTVERIERWGASWRINAGGEIFEAPHLVVATEAYTAARLLATLDPELALSLRSVEYPPVGVAAVTYDRDAVAHPLDGFGMLIPEMEERRILGAIFSSSLFPGRAPEGRVLLTAFFGGARAPDLPLRSREEIEFVVHSELRRALGISARPISFDLHVWNHAIPQYTLGYGRVLNTITSAEDRHPGLHLIGNYRGGVSIADCVKSARQFTSAIDTGRRQQERGSVIDRRQGEEDKATPVIDSDEVEMEQERHT